MQYKGLGFSKPINWCFLGCGHITRSHTKRLSGMRENIELSFASRSFDKASDYQKKHGGVRAFASYDDAISAEEVDVIMINTPPNSHFELAKKTIEAGKHVVIEKPPFMRSKDFDVIGNLADEKSLQVMVAENYYYKPLRKNLLKIIDSDAIGEPLFVNINATKTQKSKNDWREDKSLVGYGALFEGGIHWICFINNLGLKLKSIHGFIPRQLSELEKSIQVVAETEEGVVINLFYSWEVDTIFKGLRMSKVFGRKGSITFETNGLMIFTRGNKNRLNFPDLKNIKGDKLMFTDFIKALRSGNPPSYNWRMAQADLEWVEKAYESARQR